MIIRPKTTRSGFTLVELAIVLAVTAVLFTGVYRLLTSGNQQVKDSSVATQQSQLISSTKSFLSSAAGQGFLQNYVCGGSCGTPPINKSLPLPSSAHPAGSAGCPTDANVVGINATGDTTHVTSTAWCNALPSGFSADKTVNSYGQTYQIAVQADSTSSSAAPATYSFMILTTGGNIIPDTDGGRISSLIGADGGFVYTNQSSCNPNTAPPFIACGAYGAWATDPQTFGYPAQAAGGLVASRTYVSVDQEAQLPWLARIQVPGDNGVPTPTFNTLVSGTNLYLNESGTEDDTAINTIYGTTGNATGSGLPAYGGLIKALNSLVAGNNDSAGASSENAAVVLNGPYDPNGNPVNSPCIASTATTTNGGKGNATTNFTTTSGASCHAVLQINGNQATTGMVQANILWASSFIYGSQGSDLRIKKDIRPLGDALDDVMKLKPVTFRYKQDNRAQIGFIAQDIQKVYPQMVVSRPDMILGVDYMQMFAPLVSSVQELKKANDMLRHQLSTQDKAIKELQIKLHNNEQLQ